MNRLSRVLRVGWNFKPTGADADDAADAEVDSILGQRRQRARRRFFQAVLENDERGVLEGIRAGARLNQVNADGETPITVAARLDMQESFFCSTLAPMPMRGKLPLATALYWAVTRGWTDIALLLIERGANVSIMTTERDSPLLAATRHNHTDIALALIQAGAPQLCRSFWGYVAVEQHRGNRAVVRALLRAAPIPTSPTKTLAANATPRRRGGRPSSDCEAAPKSGASPNVPTKRVRHP